MPETDIIIFFQQVDIAEPGTPALPGGIRNAVARSGGHADRIGKPNFMIHKAVQHSDGEDGTHPSSFKHQTCTTVYFHICLYLKIIAIAWLTPDNGYKNITNQRYKHSLFTE